MRNCQLKLPIWSVLMTSVKPLLFSAFDSTMMAVVSNKNPAFSVRLSCNKKWSFHFKQHTYSARQNYLEQRKKVKLGKTKKLSTFQDIDVSKICEGCSQSLISVSDEEQEK